MIFFEEEEEERKKKNSKKRNFFKASLFRLSPAFFFVFFLPLSLQKKHTQRSNTKLLFARNTKRTKHFTFAKTQPERKRERVSEFQRDALEEENAISFSTRLVFSRFARLKEEEEEERSFFRERFLRRENLKF